MGACTSLQSKAQEAEVLASVGEGGFFPDDFELLQELGTINIQQVRVAGGRVAGSPRRWYTSS
jgi:hypothetical protein